MPAKPLLPTESRSPAALNAERRIAGSAPSTNPQINALDDVRQSQSTTGQNTAILTVNRNAVRDK
jgi:hypothetical protein